ncbi:MAG TPA: glycine dehydrogenase, partial [Candidatus Melainabacteria bacterium]|nr:glycine dehydrogenase [Candidatus Melainabacteria bacterium]
GDAQSCGNFLNFGGPSAGYMACKKEYMRQLPGRLAGVTQDKEGKRAFTLTLQTREQHIRRAKATSNICTNQALNALSMLVYSTMLGKSGFEKLARISLQRAHYLAEKLTAIDGVSLKFEKKGFFNEFVLEFDKPLEQITEKLKERDILAGVPISRMYGELKNCLLVAVTEMNPPQQLDLYAENLKEIMAELSNHGKVAGKADKKMASASS